MIKKPETSTPPAVAPVHGNRISSPQKRFFAKLNAAGWLFRAFVLLTFGVLLTPDGFARKPSTGDGSEKRITLRVSGLPNPSDTSPNAIASQRIVAQFLERNPEIDLEKAEGIRVEGMVSEVSTIMMIAGDIAPDVIQMNFRSMDTFVSNGLVAPLDDLAAQLKQEKGIDVVSQVLPQVQDVVFRPDQKGQRRLFGLPDQLLVRGLYFNRDVFQLAGLPPRAPRSWDEMVAFIRKIKEYDPDNRGLMLAGGATASWDLINFIWSAGGEAVKEIAPNDWRADFNTPNAVTAYEFYYRLVEVDRLAVRTSGTITPQERERFAMFFGYVGDNTQWEPERWGFGAMPTGPTGVRGGEVNSRVLGIYSQIQDPKVRDAAWRYIVFTCGEEAEKIRVDTLVELGQASQLNPIQLRKFGYEQFLTLSPEGFEEEFREAVKTGKPEPYGKNCNLVYQEMTYPLDQILLSNPIRDAMLNGRNEEARAEMKEILDRAVKRTDERMIGYVSPEAMKFRRTVAVAVVVVIFAGFAFVGWYVSRIFLRSGSMMSRPVSSKSMIPWFCLLPAVALILVWSYIPLIRGTVMAFQDYKLVLESAFIGLDNFASALFDATFWNSMLASFHFAAYTLTFGFITPIVLAYALHVIPRYKILYRTVYYLPAVMSATAIFFLWRELFGTDGPLNEMLRLFGFEARRAWTDDPYLAMLSCVIPGVWAGAGPGCLIYLAALKTIPEEQFEASEIDGAGFLQKTSKIVYPGLRALIFINFVGAVAASFHGATNILIMTGGGPNGITEVVSLKIFFESFARLRFGPATAMAWMLGSMLVGFTVLQLKRLSQMEFKTAK
ncbi:MAG TPA: extracellular solute-binding protein [Chthoniobacteraceae bacterium]|nr:extracellular solute-binding protein [Chthoniobacteraceae bacterium]